MKIQYALYLCDKRIKFTELELIKLEEYDKQLIKLNGMLSSSLTRITHDPILNSKDNRELFINQIIDEIHRIEDECYQVQASAELRFVENQTNGNHEVIIQNIKNSFTDFSYKTFEENYLRFHNLTLEELNDKDNTKKMIKSFALSIYVNHTRIYENYCINKNQLNLLERIGVLVMQTAREKIKQETGIDLKSDFSMIKYSEVLSDFRKIDVNSLPKSKQNDEILRFNDIKSFEMVDLTNDKRLSVAALKLIDLFAMFYEKEGYFTNKRFRMSVSEYMEICDLKHSGNARNQICQGLNNLYNLSIKMLKNDRDNRSDFFESRIIQSKSIRNGYIEVIFSDLFIQILNKRKWMNFPNQLFRIKDKINPYSHYFLKKIAEHKNMNHNKNNEDILTIKTILGSCMSFPKYEEVKNIGGITQRIKLPFYRDMDALRDTLTYSLKDDNHNEITREKANSMTYDDFVNLRVYIIWLAYPDRKKLITHTN